MRLSVHKDDPGCSLHAYGAKAFVDGKEIENCFTADEELGKAWAYDLDAFEPGMEDIPVKEYTGKVEIQVWIKS
jgi:hypothetical protein